MGVGRRNVLASYLGVGGCREEKCVSLLPRCGWVRKENVLASYLGVGGCQEEKCVSLLPRCGWMSGGEMC